MLLGGFNSVGPNMVEPDMAKTAGAVAGAVAGAATQPMLSTLWDNLYNILLEKQGPEEMANG